MIISYETRYNELRGVIHDMLVKTPESEPVARGALTLLEAYSLHVDEVAEEAERISKRGRK